MSTQCGSWAALGVIYSNVSTISAAQMYNIARFERKTALLHHHDRRVGASAADLKLHGTKSYTLMFATCTNGERKP
jgi:hypothetical protein